MWSSGAPATSGGGTGSTWAASTGGSRTSTYSNGSPAVGPRRDPPPRAALGGGPSGRPHVVYRAVCYTFFAMNPFYKNLALWMVIGLIVIVLFNLFQAKESPRDEIVFSDFLKKAERGEMRGGTLRGNMASGTPANGQSFRTITADYPDLVKALKDRGVRIIV